MKARNGWLFPLMVLAAGSVTVFGCIGIAAITGYLPLAKVSAMPSLSAANTFEQRPRSLSRAQPSHAVAAAPAPPTAARTENITSESEQKKSSP